MVAEASEEMPGGYQIPIRTRCATSTAAPRWASATRFNHREAHTGTVPRRVVQMWKVLIRPRHVEEVANGLPAVPRLVDEQSRGRNRIDDGLVVLLEDALGMGAIVEAAREGSLEDQRVHHLVEVVEDL